MKSKESKYGTRISISADTRRACLFQIVCIALTVLFLTGLTFQQLGKAYSSVYWIALSISLMVLPWGKLCRLAASTLKNWWGLDRTETLLLVLTSAFAVFAFVFAAHGFLFTNEFFSHDSITVSSYGDVNFYYTVGRFLIPPYEALKGAVPAPWLVGLLFLFWVTAATVLVVHLFEMEGVFARALAAGLICTNMSLSLTGATYIYCMDEYALSLLMAVAAAWLFCRCRHGALLGVFCLIVSLALYQSYFSVTLALCFISLIHELLSNEKAARVIGRGLRYLALSAAAFCLYFAQWTFLCRVIGQEKLRLNESILGAGISGLLASLKSANGTFFHFLLTDPSYIGGLFRLVRLLLVLLLCLWLLSWLMSKQLDLVNKLLLMAAMCLLPTALCSADVLLLGGATELSLYGRELIYLFLLLSAKWAAFPRFSKRYCAFAMAILLVVIWQNIVFSNHAYMKKDLEKTLTVTVVTRIIDRLEQTEGYIPGETPVAVVGKIHNNPIINAQRPQFRLISSQAGLRTSYAFTGPAKQYIQKYLNYPMIWNDATDFASMEEVREMPVFPAAGCTRMIDGTVVLKLS